MDEINVACEETAGGWLCTVTVGDERRRSTHHVGVTRADLERLAPDSSEPSQLVVRSFVFLLAREGQESILRSFDLPVIGRYFPEYESEIRRGGTV